MVGDADERLVDVGVREPLYFFLGVVGLLEYFVEGFDVVVEEDGGYYCQRNVGLYVLVCLVVAIHADISQQVDVTHQVVELGSIPFVKFRQGAGIFSSEHHLHYFIAFLIPEVITVVLSFRDAILYFELEVPVVELTHEET